MTEYGPENPHSFQPQLPESFLEFSAWYQKIAAVGSATLALAFGASAVAKESPPAARTAGERAIPCALNLLQGSDTDCVPGRSAALPTACASEEAVRQVSFFRHNENKRREALEIVRNQITAEKSAAGSPGQHTLLGFEDDGGITKNNQERSAGVLALGCMMGGQLKRIIVYPDRFQDQEFRDAYYGRTADLVKAAGLELQVTVACDKTVWPPQKFENFMRQVAVFFKGRAESFAVCNESNYPGWLEPTPGKSVAETYAKLYPIGYSAIKKVDPESKVIFGEFSSRHYPMLFLGSVVQAARSNGDKLIFDLLGYHPYLWFKDESSLPPLENPDVTAASEQIGIDGLHVIEQELEAYFEAGDIATSDGGKPAIAFTEFAAMSRGTGKMESRVIPDRLRAKWYVKILNHVCGRVNRWVFYQVDNAPEHSGSEDRWNSGLVNKWRELDISYYAIQEWVRRNRERCLG